MEPISYATPEVISEEINPQPTDSRDEKNFFRSDFVQNHVWMPLYDDYQLLGQLSYGELFDSSYEDPYGALSLAAEIRLPYGFGITSRFANATPLVINDYPYEPNVHNADYIAEHQTHEDSGFFKNDIDLNHHRFPTGLTWHTPEVGTGVLGFSLFGGGGLYQDRHTTDDRVYEKWSVPTPKQCYDENGERNDRMWGCRPNRLSMGTESRHVSGERVVIDRLGTYWEAGLDACTTPEYDVNYLRGEWVACLGASSLNYVQPEKDDHAIMINIKVGGHWNAETIF